MSNNKVYNKLFDNKDLLEQTSCSKKYEWCIARHLNIFHSKFSFLVVLIFELKKMAILAINPEGFKQKLLRTMQDF